MVLLKPGKLYVNNFLKYNTDPAFRKLGYNVFVGQLLTGQACELANSF